MKQFSIQRIANERLEKMVTDKIDNLTKPKGSLGRLEELALQVSLIQQTPFPILKHPCNILFAADHGITEEGVSKSPKSITWQQLYNILRGGAGINFLCRQHDFDLLVVDAGVDYDFPPMNGLLDMKIRKGTRNFLHEAAMTSQEMERCTVRRARTRAGRQCSELRRDGDRKYIGFVALDDLPDGDSLAAMCGCGQRVIRRRSSPQIPYSSTSARQFSRYAYARRNNMPIRRLRNGDGGGRYAPCCRIAHGHPCRRIHYDELPTGGFAVLS